MERGLCLLVGVVLVVLGSSDAQVAPCQELTSCSCQYQDGLILSLSALTRNDGEPAFSNVTDQGHDTFVSWNPCKPFTIEGTECVDTAICAMREGIPKTLYYNLGGEDSARFKYNENGSLILTYTMDHGDFKRSAEITLQCLQDAKFDFFVNEGEQEPDNDTIIFRMVLASRYACGYGPQITPSNEVSPLSGGAIFAIVFFSLIGAYLIFGVGYQLLVKKESGKRLCPNHEFWCNLPGSLTSPCKNASPGKDKGAAYDSI